MRQQHGVQKMTCRRSCCNTWTRTATDRSEYEETKKLKIMTYRGTCQVSVLHQKMTHEGEEEEELAATLRSSRPGVQSASLIMTPLMTS